MSSNHLQSENMEKSKLRWLLLQWPAAKWPYMFGQELNQQQKQSKAETEGAHKQEKVKARKRLSQLSFHCVQIPGHLWIYLPTLCPTKPMPSFQLGQFYVEAIKLMSCGWSHVLYCSARRYTARDQSLQHPNQQHSRTAKPDIYTIITFHCVKNKARKTS